MITGSGNQFQRTGSQSGRQQQKGPENSKCYRCGGSYPHKEKCPATNKTCHKCNKTGHFENVADQRTDH